MGKNISDAAWVAAKEAYENEYETRWWQLGEDYQEELAQEAQDKIDAQKPQFIPTKPTDEEAKAEIRRIFTSAAANNPTIDQAQIDDATEEMFQIIKKSFGNG